MTTSTHESMFVSEIPALAVPRPAKGSLARLVGEARTWIRLRRIESANQRSMLLVSPGEYARLRSDVGL